MQKPKKTTTTNDKLVQVISRGFKEVGQKLIEAYRGVSELISALRGEMHERFSRIERIVDRLEKIILADRKRRKVR